MRAFLVLSLILGLMTPATARDLTPSEQDRVVQGVVNDVLPATKEGLLAHKRQLQLGFRAK